MAKRKSFSINRSLSQGLEETITAAHDYSGELLVDVIPLNRIELDPLNPRELHISLEEAQSGLIDAHDNEKAIKQQELESLRTLSNSIKNQGLINAVMVYKHGDNYRLVAGERRSLASLMAGCSSIQARILDTKPDKLKRTILQWVENIEREDLSLWERLSNIKSIMQAYCEAHDTRFEQMTGAQLSELVGVSPSQSAQYKVVLLGCDELINAIKNNQVANLDKAAFIVKAPSSHLSMLITLCEQGASLKEMKAAIDTVSVIEKQHQVGKGSSFRVAIKSEKVVKTIIESLLSTDDFIHLRTQYENCGQMSSEALSKRFNQLVKKIEKIVG
jgi:ParB family transcriptional regulator, chromosome partitioning protein